MNSSTMVILKQQRKILELQRDLKIANETIHILRDDAQAVRGYLYKARDVLNIPIADWENMVTVSVVPDDDRGQSTDPNKEETGADIERDINALKKELR